MKPRKPRTAATKERKAIVNDAASKIFNQQMGQLDNEYSKLANAEKYEFCFRYNISDLFLDDYNYDDWFISSLESDEKVPPMPPLEGHEEIYYSVPSTPLSKSFKEGKGLKILTPKKLLTRLQISLTQIKAGNNSNKLKGEIREILYLLYQHNKSTKKLYNSLIKSL